MSIESQLKAISNLGTKKAMEVFIVSGIRVGNMMITASPWDKGSFKNNWNTENNAISYDTSKPDNTSGSTAMNELAVTFANADLGDYVTFNNPMPYGPRLEYDGWSDQAPNGFVRVNAAKWPAIVQEEILKRR